MSKFLLVLIFVSLFTSNLLMISIKADVLFLKKNQIEAVNQLEFLEDVTK